MSEPTPTTRTTTETQAAVPAIARMCLRSLFSAWRAAAVYDENNSVYRKRRDELTSNLEELRRQGIDCRIDYQNDYFFFNGTRLNYDREFNFGRALASRFGELGLGGMAIASAIGADELDRALFALAQADRRADDPFAALSETWKTLGIDAVTITPLPVHASQRLSFEAAGVDPRTARRRRAQALFLRSETVVQEFWEHVRDRNSFDSAIVQRVVHQLIDELAKDEEILLEFASLKDFDEYTYFHSVNVAIYAIAVGMRLGLDRVRLAHLGLAALFHDIGKVKLPHDVITKPGDFDEEDWIQIKRHPALGALTLAALRPIDGQVGTAMASAFEHHVKMDLSGYPPLSHPRPLHMFSRIISLCDAFDAMTSGRVYQKESVSPDEAVRRLVYRGRDWYDPVIVKAFVHAVGIFPVGTVGRLSDGSIAVVTRNDAADLYAPEVLVIRDENGHPIRRAVRLSREQDGAPSTPPLHIAEILDPDAQGINIGDYLGLIYRPSPNDVMPAETLP